MGVELEDAEGVEVEDSGGDRGEVVVVVIVKLEDTKGGLARIS
jgi:hypothetical protein